MSLKPSWLVAAGVLVMLIGLCFIPAAFGEHGDRNLLGLGASIFSMGALTIASGIYLKASGLGSKTGSNNTPEEDVPSKPVRGACDRCQKEMPVIQCKVHQ